MRLHMTAVGWHQEECHFVLQPSVDGRTHLQESVSNCIFSIVWVCVL